MHGDIVMHEVADFVGWLVGWLVGQLDGLSCCMVHRFVLANATLCYLGVRNPCE